MAAAWIPLIEVLEPEIQALITDLVHKIWHAHQTNPSIAKAAAQAAVSAAHVSLSSNSLDADEPTPGP